MDSSHTSSATLFLRADILALRSSAIRLEIRDYRTLQDFSQRARRLGSGDIKNDCRQPVAFAVCRSTALSEDKRVEGQPRVDNEQSLGTGPDQVGESASCRLAVGKLVPLASPSAASSCRSGDCFHWPHQLSPPHFCSLASCTLGSMQHAV